MGSGDITVNSGTVQNTDASGGRAINNYGAGNVTVNGGRNTASTEKRSIAWTGTVSISGSEWDGEAGTLVSSDCSDMEAILLMVLSQSAEHCFSKYIAVEAHSGVNSAEAGSNQRTILLFITWIQGALPSAVARLNQRRTTLLRTIVQETLPSAVAKCTAPKIRKQ